MNKLKFIFLTFLIGLLGVLNVWINNVVYYKAKYIDSLKDERDFWYVKYMNSIKNYYQRRWGYEDENFSNPTASDTMVFDSTGKTISGSSIR